MRSKSFIRIVVFSFLLWHVLSYKAFAGESLLCFGGEPLAPITRSAMIDYNIDPRRVPYFVHIPSNYTGKEAFGLIVYISPGDVCTGVPSGWIPSLANRHLLFVAPEGAGNNTEGKRRAGLAVLGALEMTSRYKIDPKRIYVAGCSGGARTASHLGFWQSDLFCGTIQNCGTDFYRPVPVVNATSMTDTLGKQYGLLIATNTEIENAKRSVRFALVTGSNDFRRDNVLDIYEGGFLKDSFHAKLFDIPGMKHEDCSAETLEKVLDFLER